ncbi:MAG TPA: hypothetical protein VHB02_02680 [Acidimicrobiales bacterium]|nr:hypothetical protein [Acidimicrobiales bacterium]
MPDPPEPALGDPTPLRFTGVRQLPPDSDEGPAADAVRLDAEDAVRLDMADPVRLDVDDAGLAATGADGAVRWSVPWSAVVALATPERTATPAGDDAVVVTVHIRSPADGPGGDQDGQVRRFAITTAQPAAVEDVLLAAARYRGVPAHPPPAGPPERTAGPRFDALGPVRIPGQVAKAGPAPVNAVQVDAVQVDAVPPVDEAPPADPVPAEPAPLVEHVPAPGAEAPGAEVAGDDADRSAPWWVVVPAVAGTGAVVAVLLLAAGHVVHL